MTTYKFKALDSGGKHTIGVLEAISPQDALRKVKEQGLFPTDIEPVSQGVHDSSVVSPTSETPYEILHFRSFGWKIRVRKLLIFHIPFVLVIGIGMYLFFTDRPAWLVFIIGVIGLITFGIAGMLVEQKMLDSFVCPRCQSPVGDWDRDAKYRIFYDCGHCRIRWDIGYTLNPKRQ